MPSGEEVNFYQVIPLYRNEMEYKMEHDADALLKKMAGISFVVNPTRQNAITRGTLAEEEFTGDMDDAAWHLESIQEKGLPVNEINAYNHMAIYLRWCIEHDLMSAEFMERYGSMVAGSIVLKAKSLHLPKDAFSADFLINDLERSNLY